MGFTTKAILVLVVLGALGLGWYAWRRNAGVQEGAQTSQQVPQPSTNTAGAPPGSGISGSGSSDTALDADLNLMDTQLQAASADSASAQSFSDTPVAQTE